MASPFIWKAGVSVWEFYTVQSWSPQTPPRAVTILCLEQLLHSSFSVMPLLLGFSPLSSIFFESNLLSIYNHTLRKYIHYVWTKLYGHHSSSVTFILLYDVFLMSTMNWKTNCSYSMTSKQIYVKAHMYCHNRHI